MIGQKKLLDKLHSYTIETLPHTLLFIGEEGCGKKTVINQLAYVNGLEIVNVDKDITFEQIIDYQYCPIKKMYTVNLSEFTEKQQNKILKFIEEPSETVYIALIATSEIGILDTILNRCIKYIFEPYSIEELKAADVSNSDNELLYHICRTPGQLAWVNRQNLDELLEICRRISLTSRATNYSDLIAITEKINTKESFDKFDFNIFFNALLYISYNEYLKNGLNNALTVYMITADYLQRFANKLLVKEQFLLSYFTAIWEAFN